MSVVAKTGDDGFTKCFSGKVKKTHPIIKAVGSVQNLGYSVSQVLLLKYDNKDMYNIDDELVTIQNWLFDLGAYIAVPLSSLQNIKFTEDKEIYIHSRIKWIEKEIPQQTSFIIPNGNPFSIGLFKISGKVRKTEIDIISAIENNKNMMKTVVPFINRLSDYFYVLARYVNHHHKIISPPYKKNMKMNIGKDGNAIILI